MNLKIWENPKISKNLFKNQKILKNPNNFFLIYKNKSIEKTFKIQKWSKFV